MLLLSLRPKVVPYRSCNGSALTLASSGTCSWSNCSPLGVRHDRNLSFAGLGSLESWKFRLCVPGEVCSLCSCPLPAGTHSHPCHVCWNLPEWISQAFSVFSHPFCHFSKSPLPHLLTHLFFLTQVSERWHDCGSLEIWLPKSTYWPILRPPKPASSRRCAPRSTLWPFWTHWDQPIWVGIHSGILEVGLNGNSV